MIKYLESIANASINLGIAFFITCYFGENKLLVGLLGFTNLCFLHLILFYVVHELEKIEEANNNQQ